MASFRLFFFLFFYCLSFALYADISVSPIVVDLVDKERNAEIAVKNFDTKNNAYVEITSYLLTDPANASSKKRVRYPEKDGLIVFPAKLVLLPGQTQFVRVVKTAKNIAKDKVYEVDFIPKLATHLVNQKNSDGSRVGIRVIIGYGARVTLRPDVPSPSLSLKRVNKELIIRNTGNTSISITSCTQQLSGKKMEISLPAYTLFVGQVIKKELTRPSRVTLNAAVVGKPLGTYYTD